MLCGTMSEHFCTYFDHRYLAQGLAMWRSLKTHAPSAILHVLCLSESCREILTGLHPADVHLHALDALEAGQPELRPVRGNRSLVEYYFTLTPCLPLHVFGTHPEVPRVTYVDADILFFADPQPVLEELRDASVGLIEHRFPPDLAYLEKHGRFNVGWMTFRNDSPARGCLEEWRGQCIEWCYDRVEPGRFAEQKYLDPWPGRYPGVHVIEHKGANVAPWNLTRFALTLDAGELRVDDQPVLFVHFHGFQPRTPDNPSSMKLAPYGVAETPVLRALTERYERALFDATAEVAVPLALSLLADYQPREAMALVDQLKARVAHLERQLADSETDRAARLRSMHRLEALLAESEADRGARLDAMHRLEALLAESEADRAARLDAMHRLEALLAESEADRAARLSWRLTRLARWMSGRLRRPGPPSV
jgi:hypothetical protein